MSRFILTFILLVFTANVANASVLMTCCPHQQKAMEKPAISKCHDHHPSSPADKKSKSSGCLCAFTCVTKIKSDDMNLTKIFISMIHIPLSWANDSRMSLIVHPEIPPPKA